MRPKSPGFTLVEVLLALVLLAVTVVVASSQIGSMRLNRDSRANLSANQAVQTFLDGVTLLWHENASAYQTTTITGAPRTVPDFSWTVRVTAVNPTTNSPVGTTHTFTSASPGDFPVVLATDATLAAAVIKRVEIEYVANTGSGRYSASTEVARP